jgi:hypothetical protein
VDERRRRDGGMRTGGQRPHDWGRATQNRGGRGLGQGGRAGEHASGRADAQGSGEKVAQVYVSTSYFVVVDKVNKEKEEEG